MTERTICPACSAPLEYTSSDEQVRCGFCGAEYRVVQEGDQARLQVTSKPQPQSDELSRVGQEVARDVEQDAVEDIAGSLPGTIPEAEGDPVAPGFATSATTGVYPELPEAESFRPTGEPLNAVDLPPAYDAQSGRGAPYESVGPAVQRPPTADSKRKQWIALGVSFFVVFCLLCLCVTGAVLVFLFPTGATFGF
jgi:LSD1 subclass zinc finger protein